MHKNRQLIDKAPRGHWKITTFVTALRKYGFDRPEGP